MRLRRNYERRAGCRHCLLSDSRRDSFITCSIEAFIECRIRKSAQPRAVYLHKLARLATKDVCMVGCQLDDASSIFIMMRVANRTLGQYLHKPVSAPSMRIGCVERFEERRRAWQSADPIQAKSRSNIAHDCETACPHNCCLGFHLHFVYSDRSGGIRSLPRLF